MTKLQVRRPPFDFDGDVPFLWNAESPAFSLMMNAISFMAIGFEKLVVTATRQAIPLLAEPAVAAEADAFLRQEAQHAASHRLHVKALIRKYPGLAQTLDETIACYDELLVTKSLKFNLAYTADLEAIFTPFFKMLLDHADRFFEPGDERVASLFLWHFVEEIEHRSSALLIYRAIGSEAYRLGALPSVVRHIYRVLRVFIEGFNAHVPFEDRKVDANVLLPSSKARRYGDPFWCVPPREGRVTTWNILRAQVPNHDPEHQPLPRLAALWMDRYARGENVARWFSSARAQATL